MSLPHKGHSMVWVQLKYHASKKHFDSDCDFPEEPTSFQNSCLQHQMRRTKMVQEKKEMFLRCVFEVHNEKNF